MSAYLRIAFQFLLFAVALMTGILSLFREALSIFAPHKAPPRSLFWNCVIIAFILSASILWYQEHRKAISNKPKLNAEFGIFSVAPAGEENEDSIITISATITNRGAPSIVQHIKIEIETENKRFNGQFLTWPKNELKLRGEGRTYTIESKNDLIRKCLSQPIVTGGAVRGIGWLLFSGLAQENVRKKGTILILTFDDVSGKKYCFKEIMSGERTPPPDITKLQKKE